MIFITAEDNIITETTNVDSLQTIQYLERTKTSRLDEQPGILEKPTFTVALRGPNDVNENERVCMECRVIPVGDPNMTFTWYKNGKELQPSSRIATSNDFGYVFLDIASAEQNDSGIYMIKVENNYGEAVTSHNLKVHTYATIDRESIHPGSYKRIKDLETIRFERPSQKEPMYDGPRFTNQLNSVQVNDNENIFLDATVYPTNDENLRIEWYKNGQPLVLGSRITPYHEFGRVALNIASAKSEDSGIYVCRAVNQKGDATSSCSIKVGECPKIDTSSMFPDSLPTLQYLEVSGRKRPTQTESKPPTTVPYFKNHIQNVELYEGENANFECTIEPAHDPNLNITVLHNGNKMKTGNRILITTEFGYIRIVINCVKPEDAGIYSVKVSNDAGETTSSASLKVLPVKTVEYGTKHPSGKDGLKAIHQLEGSKVYATPYEAKEPKYPTPKFVKPLFAQYNTFEGDEILLECQISPSDDPSLNLEWFVNGAPLVSSSRITHYYDITTGQVKTTIKDLLHKDSGVYKCWYGLNLLYYYNLF